jgi:4,5-dihydroxyphthalate decarboxylase
MPKLTAAVTTYPHTEPLTTGKVGVDGFDIDFSTTPGNVVQIFRRMSRERLWDISEMGITTALCAKEYSIPFTLIPVFVTRRFDHEAIYYNVDRISDPKELEGKQIAMRSPNVPDTLWALGVLSDTYGVDLSKVTWYATGEEHVEEAVVDDRCKLLPGANLDELIESGEVAAVMHSYRGSHPKVRRLVEDGKAAERDWYAKYGYVPIHHAVVVKNDVLNRYPGFGDELLNAFRVAKEPLVQRLAKGEDVLSEMKDPRHAYGAETTKELLMSDDPVPYGIEENRIALEALVRYAYQQGTLSRPLEIEELFAWSS